MKWREEESWNHGRDWTGILPDDMDIFGELCSRRFVGAMRIRLLIDFAVQRRIQERGTSDRGQFGYFS